MTSATTIAIPSPLLHTHNHTGKESITTSNVSNDGLCLAHTGGYGPQGACVDHVRKLPAHAIFSNTCFTSLVLSNMHLGNGPAVALFHATE